MSPAAASAASATPPRIEVRVLGRFAVAVDGAELPARGWPALRAAHLVQLLSLASARALPREQVIDALWPQLDPEAGAANLRKAAHHARQALGTPEAIVLRSGQVMLWPGRSVAVDAEAFEAAAAAALAARDRAACAKAADTYAGELLPGSAYESWTEHTRTRLRARYLELLRVGEQWERLALADPGDEPAHRALMQRELAAGNRAAAIRWYSRLRAHLQQAFGVAPEPQTQALFERCVAGLKAAGPAYVGRDIELAQAGAWLRTRDGERPGGFVVRGAAGMGKTAFCRELATRAREAGWTCVRVDAVQPDRPHAAIAAAVDRLLLEDRSLAQSLPPAIRPVLAQLSPLAGATTPLQGPLGRHQVIGAFRALLLAASDGDPVLVQVDDAHLLDQADVDVVLQLCATGRPVHVLLALRPPAPSSPLARGIARLLAAGQLAAMELEPLGDAEVANLAAQSATRPLGAAALDRIVHLAEGHPFAAIELARANAGEAGAPLPANVAEAITARLCDLPPDAVAMLKALALAGDAFDAVAAAALSPWPEELSFRLLDAALDAGVLLVADARYRFRHELVRQALVEQVPPHQRRKLHRDAAQRLAAVGAPPAVVARQWLAAGSAAEAQPWLLRAAREALRLAAFADALELLEPVLGHDPGHAEALQLQAEAFDALGDPRAVATYRRAADAAGGAAWHELRAKAALAQIKQGDPKGALLALQDVQPTSVEGRLCEALAYSGAAALGVADPAMGTAKAAQARRLALETGDASALLVASWAQAAAAHARGDLHGSVWADLHETAHVPRLAMRVFDGQLCITQRFLYGAQPYPDVIAFADALASEAKRIGAARGHAFGVTLRGEAELLAGDVAAAEQHLALGARLHRAIGAATGEAFSLQRLAEAALLRGRRDEAQARIDEALEIARTSDVGFHLLDRIYGTRIALAPDPEAALHALAEARDAVRGPLETCPGCRITFAVPAAIAAARAGRIELAGQYEQDSGYLARVVMRLPAWYAALDEVHGHVARARGETEACARGHFRIAAERFRGAGQPLDAARCEALAAGGTP